MMLLAASVVGLMLALLPAAMFRRNLPRFRVWDDRPTDEPSATDPPEVAVLIPARDEADGIAAAIESVSASRGVRWQLLVLDDHSADETAAIVERYARQDSRVRCLTGNELPPGWNGKQFACYQLAQAARSPLLVFLDADVRLRPDTLRLWSRRHSDSGVALSSIFPHQQTGTWLEKWIIPLMHWILLGFLPLERMRQSTHPAYSAGCGQAFMTGRQEYERAGTHAAIAGSRHDGVKLPRAYREAGMATDVLDGTELAECRMYRSAGEVIRGVLKNAVEGIAAPGRIVPFTLIILGGSLLPWVTLALAWAEAALPAALVSAAALVLSYQPRVQAAVRLRQSPLGAICHPLAVTLFVLLQWVALAQYLTGRQVAWRGRG